MYRFTMNISVGFSGSIRSLRECVVQFCLCFEGSMLFLDLFILGLNLRFLSIDLFGLFINLLGMSLDGIDLHFDLVGLCVYSF